MTCLHGRPVRLADPACEPCPDCDRETAQQIAAFEADIAAGKYDADGRTPAEQAAAERRRLERGRLW